jgi:hypothetical protein
MVLNVFCNIFHTRQNADCGNDFRPMVEEANRIGRVAWPSRQPPGKVTGWARLASGNPIHFPRETVMTCRAALRTALILASTLLLSVPASAQLFRAYLAADGNDANPCTLPAPCRLLPAALSAVSTGGEIWMLDSANYNTATVVIGKSVTILAVPGTVGSVLAIGGPAISIAAAGLKVALRNLVIVPLLAGGGTHGVYMTGASTLSIEDSLLANLINKGVYVLGTGTVEITNTTLRNNGDGVYAQDGATVSISGTKLLGNGGAGVTAYSPTAITTTAVVSDSVITGGAYGVNAFSSIAGAIAKVLVTRCTIDNVYNGLSSDTSGAGSALVTVSGSMITNTTYPWWIPGAGAVKSLGNNHVQDNATAGVGTPTTASLQ